MVNKQGQTRLASYFEWISMTERTALESEIIRRCLTRTEFQCSFVEYRGYKIVYRRYASLFFVVGVDGDEENELGILEFIHCLVETMDKYFDSVCELDIMYHIDKASEDVFGAHLLDLPDELLTQNTQKTSGEIHEECDACARCGEYKDVSVR